MTDLKTIPLGSIWRSSSSWFLEGRYTVEIADTLYRSLGDYGGRPLYRFALRFDIEGLYELPEHPGYAVARSKVGRDPRYVLLVELDGDERRVVGGLESWGLYIDEAHRGQGLGAWLAWAGMSLSGENTTDYGLYSKAGYAAFASAHRIAVEMARKHGHQVSEEALDRDCAGAPDCDDGEFDGYDY
jgi:GNAT superfamily N-acetyltransferase